MRFFLYNKRLLTKNILKHKKSGQTHYFLCQGNGDMLNLLLMLNLLIDTNRENCIILLFLRLRKVRVPFLFLHSLHGKEHTSRKG